VDFERIIEIENGCDKIKVVDKINQINNIYDHLKINKRNV
jgi:hypothetical protein